MTRRSMCLVWILSLALGIFSGSGCGSRGYQFGELTQLADKYQTDKGSRLHRYTEVYECFFHPMRSSARKICEIGIMEGASLRMLADYFGRAVIYGIDIEKVSHLDSDRIHTFVADQADRKQLAAFTEASGSGFDLIIDDGGHSMAQQQISFASLFRHVLPGGYYIIEDVHTSLLDDYGVEPGGVNSTLTMIERYARSGRIESKYMTAEERQQLEWDISYCSLVSRNNGTSIACIFRKRQPQ